MIDSKLIQELTEKFINNLKNNNTDNLNKKNISKTFKVILEQTFANLDLVTRQQFDAQNKVLENTKLKLNKLEQQLQQLSEI